MSATRMITYYEKEIYESDFAINQCDDYVQLMKKYLEGGTWTYLTKAKGKKQIGNLPYFDIDAIDDNWPCSYYWELTQFLNKRESWLKDKMKKMGKAYQPYRYIAPNNCKKPEGAKWKQGSDTNEIIVKGDNNEEKFRLKSDQFGFSVGDSRAKFDSHPYGYLCKLVEKETKEEKERVYGVIAECIYHTRTLGGGFLWQVDPDDARNQKAVYGYYNINRGTKSYIEDRVDLTLLEIKHLFEWIELGKPEKNLPEDDKVDCFFKKISEPPEDRLSTRVIKKYKEETGVSEYIKWLEHFDTFGNYIEFFCFDYFVDRGNWMPFDIMESKLKWDDESKRLIWERENAVFLEEPTKYKQRKAHSIYREDRTAAELEQMLENVRILTLARSYRMQEVIDGVSN